MDPRLSHDCEEDHDHGENGNAGECTTNCKPENDGFLMERIFKIPPRQPNRQEQHSAGVVVNSNGTTADDSDKAKYCWVCEHDVAEQSMHCRYCNKCVSKFDHHCQWLNTCVGERNYPYFFKTLWSIAALLIVHMGVLIGLAIDILIGGSSQQRANDWFSADLYELVVAFQLFFFLFDLVCLSLILQLVSFHIKLQKKGLTTYQYILQDNVVKRERNKVTRERQTNRTAVIADAASNPVLRYRLILGQYLERIHPCCDPLPREKKEQEMNGNGHQHEASNEQQATEEDEYKEEDEPVETTQP